MGEDLTVDEEFLDRLEKRIEDLRSLFEQYFMGTRKVPPLQDRASVNASINRVANMTLPNIRMRFRFQQLVAKFRSYNQYWNRVLTQIEQGTYFRSKFKEKIHAAAAAAAKTPPEQTSAPAPAKAAKDQTSQTPAPADPVDQIYRDFVAARKQLNLPANISKEKLAENMMKQKEQLEQKYKGKEVKFKVVVEDGKAKLKATVK